MARRHTFILLAVGLIAMLVAVRFLGRDTPPRPSPSAAKPERAPLPVYTHRVLPEPLREEVTAAGTIRAAESIDLISEVTGKVVELAFEEGASVQRGQLLLRLDDAELRAELARAQHRVSLARVQADRQRELLSAQGTSQQNYDAAINEVRVLEAEVNLIRAQLEKTELRAPFSGVIGLRYVSIGSFVNPSTRIATLQNMEELKIDFSIAERHMTRVHPGAEISVTVAGREAPLHGRVYAIEPQIDPATRTLLLRARVDNPGGILPGAFATVRLTLREIPEALLIPATALVPALNEQRVFVVRNGRAEPRVVETGLRLTRTVQITSGLEPGDEVITSGQLQVEPGAAVRPVQREAASAMPDLTQPAPALSDPPQL